MRGASSAAPEREKRSQHVCCTQRQSLLQLPRTGSLAAARCLDRRLLLETGRVWSLTRPLRLAFLLYRSLAPFLSLLLCNHMYNKKHQWPHIRRSPIVVAINGVIRCTQNRPHVRVSRRCMHCISKQIYCLVIQHLAKFVFVRRLLLRPQSLVH